MTFARRYRNTPSERASKAGDQTRTRVLDAALDLFAAAGYRATSLAKVAQHADISPGTLLHRFPSKAALLTAALAYHQQTHQELDSDTPPGWAAFDTLVELVTRNATQPSILRLQVALATEALDPDSPAHHWTHNRHNRHTTWLTTAIDRGRDQFHPNVPAATLVRQTIATMNGLQHQWLTTGQNFDLAKEFRHYIDTQKQTWKP